MGQEIACMRYQRRRLAGKVWKPTTCFFVEMKGQGFAAGSHKCLGRRGNFEARVRWLIPNLSARAGGSRIFSGPYSGALSNMSKVNKR